MRERACGSRISEYRIAELYSEIGLALSSLHRSCGHHMRASRKFLILFIGFVVAGVAILSVAFSYPALFDPRCRALVVAAESDAPIPLSSDCKLTTDVPYDEVFGYLERERKERGLAHSKWITCCLRRAGTPVAGFDHDPHWLQTYRAIGYQFRRTVVILSPAEVIPSGSPIAGELCVMRWRRYISLIGGQCEEKLSLWK